MERNSASLAWGFHYMPNTPLIHTHRRNLFQDAREKTLDPRYSYSTMAADRTASYIAPCYWPPHYSTPYGVSHHGSNPTAAKRSPINSCECSACVTSSSSYKPIFVHPEEGRKNDSTPPMQLYPGREMPTTRDLTNDIQTYNAAKVSPSGLCMTNGGSEIGTGPRRGRTVFTAQQLQVLERVFSTTQYIVGSQRKFLASQLGLSETQVRVWFQNRRIKWRKQMLTRSING